MHVWRQHGYISRHAVYLGMQPTSPLAVATLEESYQQYKFHSRKQLNVCTCRSVDVIIHEGDSLSNMCCKCFHVPIDKTTPQYSDLKIRKWIK
jgi:hypothetical protein